MLCAVCHSEASLWRTVDGYDYTDCPSCESIALNPHDMAKVDAGTFPRRYDPDYWQCELIAAKERSWGSSLARFAEAVLYCRRPIRKLVDIGTGPGYLLDALSTYLPESRSIFYGVELFPPDVHSDHPNYIEGELGGIPHQFDAGLCVEVVEHLTPSMMRKLAQSMASRSNPEALYLVNTGLSPFVRNELPSYIDPLARGHIVSWGMKAVRSIFEPNGFKVTEFSGRDWMFVLEYQGNNDQPMEDRIWVPCEENRKILHDPVMGSVFYNLAIDTARAYR